MIQQVQNNFQFHGLSGDDANKHLDKFLTITQSMKQNGVTDDALRLYIFPYSLTHHATVWFARLLKNSIQTFQEMASKFLSKYFPFPMVTKLRNDISNFQQLPDESLFEAHSCSADGQDEKRYAKDVSFESANPKGFDGGSVKFGDNRTCTIKGTRKVKIPLHDGSSFIPKDVRYVSGLRRSLISLGTLEKEGYMVKMQMGRIKVSNDDAAIAQRRLEDKQLEENINTDCLVKEQEKVHLDTNVEANIMVTEVPGQEGTEGNVAEKKKVKESIKTNLEKLLKYNTWSTRWSPIRGSSKRKRC
ncbi:reverse transcriptase domain-containing protein [Tanacetum coccineum]|uniref:Reverse transcriptase domain-containing protein n=1 Tax=Tanacetum coccineum TaxID=301880 RepID=A0ABQ5FA69_9ASTR